MFDGIAARRTWGESKRALILASTSAVALMTAIIAVIVVVSWWDIDKVRPSPIVVSPRKPLVEVPPAPPPPTPRWPQPPRRYFPHQPGPVPPEALERYRTTGNPYISLPDSVIIDMLLRGQRATSAHAQFCLSPTGVPMSVRLVTSTGYAAADETIIGEVLTWRYRPYTVHDHPAAVCTTMSFQFALR